MAGMRPGSDTCFRAYGEMVGILWKARKYSEAIEVEQFWNRMLAHSPLSLFCGYEIDVFSEKFQGGSLDAVLCTHTAVFPSADGGIELSIKRAMDEVLGPESDGLRALMKADLCPAWPVMPSGLSTVLWLRNNMPYRADEILKSARRHHDHLQLNKQRRARNN